MSAEQISDEVFRKARAKGATQGDLLIVKGDSYSIRVRLGEVDRLEYAREHQLGLRLFFGKRSAVSSTSDLSPASVDGLVEDTCALARRTAHDEAAGLPEPDQCVRAVPDLDLWDPRGESLSIGEKIDMARRVEAAALNHDAMITNSEGGSFDHADSTVYYANSHGFKGEYRASAFSISAIPVAGQDGSMQRDYWYSYKRRLDELESCEAVGRTAAERALRRLGARKMRTRIAPVVFEPPMAGRLLSCLAGALSGYAVYKGTSFLAERLGTQIASPLVTIYDDGTLPRGLGSRPFDGEGLPTHRRAVVQGGVLHHYLLDTYSARKLGMVSTGNAARGVGDGPTVATNSFYLDAGTSSPEEILRSVKSGLYVTELIGFGVNPATGDFSQGAVGIWIEKGRLVYPVEEITIAGNLNQMLSDIEMIGNDLEFRGSISAPTLKVRRMTIAGS